MPACIRLLLELLVSSVLLCTFTAPSNCTWRESAWLTPPPPPPPPPPPNQASHVLATFRAKAFLQQSYLK